MKTKAKDKTAAPEIESQPEAKPRSLSSILSKSADMRWFRLWIIGDTPLITQAWSEKAKREMLQKQVKATRSGREASDPEADYVSSLYEMGDGTYGFPATGLKNSILSVAHKDRGVARSAVMGALWLNG